MNVELVQVECPTCKGTGADPDPLVVPRRCPQCDGLGWIADWEPEGEE